MNPISMASLGEIGWYLRLEILSKSKVGGLERKEKEKERLK